MISRRMTWILLAIVAALMIGPLVFVMGDFTGSDDQGSAAVEASRPGFKPWAHPVWTPPSPEIESLLFATQAAFGAGIIGYVIGRTHGRSKDSHKHEQQKS
jgi:cobalt/nickel transport protein